MNPCIVLVETSKIVRRALEITLAQLGHPLIAVEDANAALEVIENRPTLLVITASKLSGVDGYSLAHRLSEDPSTGHLPILLLLSRGESFDASRAGPDSIFAALEKPFLSQTVVHNVCSALGLSVPDEELYRPYMAAVPLARPPQEPTSDVTDLPPDSVNAEPAADVSESSGKDTENDALVDAVDERSDVIVIQENEGSPDGEVPEDNLSDSIDQDDPTESVLDILETVDAEPLIEVTDPPVTDMDTESEVGRHVPDEPMTVRFDEDDLDASDDVEMPSDPSVLIDENSLSAAQDDSAIDPPTEDAIDPPTVDDLSHVESLASEVVETALVQGVTATAVDQLAKDTHVAVSSISKDVIEAIAWEVIPPLAEAILREEISRILKKELP